MPSEADQSSKTFYQKNQKNCSKGTHREIVDVSARLQKRTQIA
jgi:hypothetical protein